MSLETLDRWRHKIPFWWWIAYDSIVLAVIVFGIRSVSDPWLWIGLAVLGVAVVIDVVEFIVKRPSARARLTAYVVDEPTIEAGNDRNPDGSLYPSICHCTAYPMPHLHWREVAQAER